MLMISIQWALTALLSLAFATSDPRKSHLQLVHCSRCLPGWGVERRCNATHPTVCRPCVSGTFSFHQLHYKKCTACARCGVGLYTELPCTRTHDAKCDSCDTLRGRFNQDFVDNCVKVSKLGREKSGSLLEVADRLILRNDLWPVRGNKATVRSPEGKNPAVDGRTEAVHSNGVNYDPVPISRTVAANRDAPSDRSRGRKHFAINIVSVSSTHPPLIRHNHEPTTHKQNRKLNDLESDFVVIDEPLIDDLQLSGGYQKHPVTRIEPANDTTEEGMHTDDDIADLHHSFRVFDGEKLSSHPKIPMKPSVDDYPHDVSAAIRSQHQRFYAICGLALMAFLVTLAFLIALLRGFFKKSNWSSRYQRMQLLLTDADNTVIAQCAERLSNDSFRTVRRDMECKQPLIQVYENPIGRFLDRVGSEESLA